MACSSCVVFGVNLSLVVKPYAGYYFVVFIYFCAFRISDFETGSIRIYPEYGTISQVIDKVSVVHVLLFGLSADYCVTWLILVNSASSGLLHRVSFCVFLFEAIS